MPVSTTKMFKELESLLEKYGISVKSWEMGKRHRKVWVTDGSKTALIVVSVSPSDHRVYMNIAQSARNALREAR
jgi:hypothetical protein